MRKEVKEVAERILESDRIHVLAHLDADGISAAAIIVKALLAIEKPFELRILDISSEGFRKAYNDRKDLQGRRLLLDLGSDLTIISGIFPEPIVVDHHQITGTGKALLFNPRKYGYKTPTAVLAYLIAKRLDPGAYRYSYLALVGARGDGMLGDEPKDDVIKSVVKEAESKNIIKIERDRLVYDYNRKISEVIASLVDSSSEFYRRPSEVAKILKELEIPDEKFSALSEKNKILLQERFNIRLSTIYRILVRSEPMLKTVHEFATLLNACSKMGHPEVALAIALGDRELYPKAYNIYQEYRKSLGSALYTSKSRAFTYRDTIDVVMLDDKDYKKASTIASIMRKNRKRPLVVIAYNGDKIRVSARGNNIGYAIRRAAELVGGEGGGHENAAGATIPKGKLNDFLDTLVGLLRRG